MADGKCPACGMPVTNLVGNAVTANFGGGGFHALTFQCSNPDCNVILGCQIDPTIIRNEIVERIQHMLSGDGESS